MRRTEDIKENVSAHNEKPSESGVIYSLNRILPIVYDQTTKHMFILFMNKHFLVNLKESSALSNFTVSGVLNDLLWIVKSHDWRE